MRHEVRSLPRLLYIDGFFCFQITLNIYSFENVVYHVLKWRIHLFSDDTLTSWFGKPLGDINRFVFELVSHCLLLSRKEDDGRAFVVARIG